MLHPYILEDILNRLENAKDVSNARLVCKAFRAAGSRVRSLRIVCLIKYHDLARGDRSENEVVSVDKWSGAIANVETPVASFTDRGAKGEAKDRAESSSTNPPDTVEPFIFRTSVEKTLSWTKCISQLRIEIEAKLQSKIVPESERRKTDFWLSDPLHVKIWIISVKSTLQHLCVVDYGQQAIMRRTTILTILSQNCELSNPTRLFRIPYLESFEILVNLVTTRYGYCMEGLCTIVFMNLFGKGERGIVVIES